MLAEFLAAEVDAGGDVAPLVAAADLQFAVVVAAQHVEVERLQQHVAELGVADADFAVFHAGADAFLGDHLVDGKMFSDVAQEIEIAKRAPSTRRCPRGARDCCCVSKSSSLASCSFHAGDVVVEDFLREQLALRAFCRWDRRCSRSRRRRAAMG